MPSVQGTHSVRRRNSDSWQKAIASSVNSKDTCPEAAQRNQAKPPMLPPVSQHKTPHLLHKSELPGQMMKKQLSLPQNKRKELIKWSIPLATSMKEKGKS
jgi:hypothetical protein